VDDVEAHILSLADVVEGVEAELSALRNELKCLRREYLAKTAPERVCPHCTEFVANEGETFTPCKQDED